MRLSVGFLWLAPIHWGCVGAADTEQSTGSIKVEANSSVRVFATETTGWHGRPAPATGDVKVSQGPISRFSFSSSDGVVSTEHERFEYQSSRVAIAPRLEDVLEVRISQNVIGQPVQWWYETRWGLVAYHRPAGTYNAWQPVVCPGLNSQLIAHDEMSKLSIFDAQITLNQNGFVQAKADGGGDTYANCGIVEDQAEFAFAAIPVSTEATRLGSSSKYHYQVFATCGPVGSQRGSCPAYVDRVRAQADTCRAQEDLWVGASFSVRALTLEEASALDSYYEAHPVEYGRFSAQGVEMGRMVSELYSIAPSSLSVGDILVELGRYHLLSLEGAGGVQHLSVFNVVGNAGESHDATIIRDGEVKEILVSIVSCPIIREGPAAP